MAAYFKAVAEGRVKPEASITLTAEDKRRGRECWKAWMRVR